MMAFLFLVAAGSYSGNTYDILCCGRASSAFRLEGSDVARSSALSAVKYDTWGAWLKVVFELFSLADIYKSTR